MVFLYISIVHQKTCMLWKLSARMVQWQGMKRVFLFSGLLLILCGTLFALYLYISPECTLWCPAEAKIVADSELFIIPESAIQEEVIIQLKKQGYIRSEAAFKFLFIADRGEKEIEPGGYAISKSMNAQEVYTVLQKPPVSIWVALPKYGETEKIADSISIKAGWSEEQKTEFKDVYRDKVKAHYKDQALELLAKENSWMAADKKASLGLYDAISYDLFTLNDYIGTRLFARELAPEEAAEELFNKLSEEIKTEEFSLAYVKKDEKARFVETVRLAVELLPDIIPAAPYDLKVISKESRTYLVFSTAYSNQGIGALELIPKAKNVKGSADVITEIIQRVYITDGTHRDKTVGKFVWHGEHGHYHYDEFMDYVLQPVNSTATRLEPLREKTSFCIRDRDLIKKMKGTPSKAQYIECDTSIQGVSVGWGDVYKYTLADQDIDITNIPAGLYTLSFEVNSRKAFEEMETKNNISSVTLFLDPKKQTVQIRK
jgi:hypothetical protein